MTATKACECGGKMRHGYENGKRAWVCNNCSRTRARRVNKPGTETTPSQAWAVEHLKATWMPRSEHPHEYKYWNVERLESGKLLVSAIVGMVGDEGTAAVMLRKNRLAKVGRNGRIEVM